MSTFALGIYTFLYSEGPTYMKRTQHPGSEQQFVDHTVLYMPAKTAKPARVSNILKYIFI